MYCDEKKPLWDLLLYFYFTIKDTKNMYKRERKHLFYLSKNFRNTKKYVLKLFYKLWLH